jgi:excisionase family DNA binding protein
MRKSISCNETCRLTGKTRTTIMAWLKQGIFPRPFKIGSQYRFYEDEIIAFLEGRWPASRSRRKQRRPAHWRRAPWGSIRPGLGIPER